MFFSELALPGKFIACDPHDSEKNSGCAFAMYF
jgi:hypothetical protein